MSQQKLNNQIDTFYQSFENTLPRKNRRVAQALDRTRNLISDILAKYANSEGKIPQSRVNAVLSELQAVESEIYQTLRSEMQAVLSQSATATATSMSTAVVAALGLATLLAFAGISQSILSAGINLSTAIFEILTGSTIPDFSTSLTDSSFNRVGDDGKVLNDRLRDIASTLRKQVSGTLRKSIRKGEVTTETIRKIRSDFQDIRWRIETLVETEALFVMRHGIAKFAELSGIAKGLKIVDYPHGEPKEHRTHECYIYSHQDPHGMGEGIYPVTTRKIRNPHPRCRSTLHIVLKEELR